MKKLWINIGIFFGCFLLLITCLGAVLIMAPGMELLGVMYIRSTSGKVELKQVVADAVQFQNIYIESDNIPVTVEFGQSYSLRVDMIEEYNGFAKAGETPSFEIEHRGDTIAIITSEYVPFLAHSRSENSGLRVQIPIYYNNNIEVVSRDSTVNFAGLGAVVNDINVKTGGSVKFNSDLYMHSLNLTLKNKDAKISDSVVMDGHIIANSKNGDLTVPTGFAGKIEFSSNGGNLLLGQCSQLEYTSKSGSVKGVNDQLPVILGDAKIQTGGKIEIGKITGAATITGGNSSVNIGLKDETCLARLDVSTNLGKINMSGTFTHPESKIKSKYGKITIENISNASIESKYGDINISETNSSLDINTKSGDVSISKVEENVNVVTKSGKVRIGSDGYIVSNANVSTKSGAITILHAGDGEIVLTTESGKIEFEQNTSYRAKLTIKAKNANVVLNNITGETNVETTGKIQANIYDVNEPINLVGKNKAVEVHVRKTCYVDLESKKKIESAPDMTEKVKQYRNAPETETKQIIKIKTNRGKISVIVD